MPLNAALISSLSTSVLAIKVLSPNLVLSRAYSATSASVLFIDRHCRFSAMMQRHSSSTSLPPVASPFTELAYTEGMAWPVSPLLTIECT